MDIYERYCELRDKIKVKDSHVAAATGIGKSTFTDWKNGRSNPKNDKLQKIADYFGVSVDYLITGNEATQLLYTCPDCGLTYVTTEYTDIEDHEETHKAWEKAVEKFGKLYCNGAENEKIKVTNRNISNDKNIPLARRCDAQLQVLRCLFSRSVVASHFNLQHVPFEEYVAMMLNNPKYLKLLDSELAQKLIHDYGTLPGIKDGHSYYSVPPVMQQAIATHNITNAEYDHIKKYRDLDDHGKEMVDMVLDKEHARVASKVIPLSRPILNAAHERTDIEVTDEMRKHDDDIMMNDKLWE